MLGELAGQLGHRRSDTSVKAGSSPCLSNGQFVVHAGAVPQVGLDTLRAISKRVVAPNGDLYAFARRREMTPYENED